MPSYSADELQTREKFQMEHNGREYISEMLPVLFRGRKTIHLLYTVTFEGFFFAITIYMYYDNA